MWTPDLPFDACLPVKSRTRDLCAALLHATSRGLNQLAVRLAAVRPPGATEAVIEFQADASAPEGALYVNGNLVGYVIGVSRL